MIKIYRILIIILFGLAIGLPVEAAIRTPTELQQLYNIASLATSTRKVRILIVPGHDEEYWGTQFREVKEADLNLELSQDLAARLKKDPQFDVVVTRDAGWYTDQFSRYFIDNTQGITDFIASTKQSMSTAVQSGAIIKKVDGVPHNLANTDVAQRLFGINKWINENNIDLVVHVHFNDAPGRPAKSPGAFRGFAVYIPDRQYDNGAISKAFGTALFTQLREYYHQSILPRENVGLVEDQDLIAVGSGNSVKAAVALVEYGYIYEPQYLDPIIRSSVIEDLAFQTYLGIHNYFGHRKSYAGQFETPLLPHTWKKTLTYGTLFNKDILHLQAALRYLKMYPVEGKEEFDCRLTGNFGPCVQAGLATFQEEYGIAGDGTSLGPKTRAKLNALFSQ